MKMTFDECSDFLLKNKNELSPCQMEKVIGLMDFQVELIETWKDDLSIHIDTLKTIDNDSDYSLEEEFINGRQMAFEAAKEAIENRLSDYVLKIKKGLEAKENM